ncbi:GMC oxidoreductase [Paenibacillus arenilitoris]|uniref:GMC family oxidoreductase N-terminal domain-containing protein n=1 Tax=Paenibacillus arenilitoris TaxID=2772299 RepID=A0A927CRY4_9BACL|nr:GMC oxidoreductase [Paenibacillus arenilitoris]MBD2872077.1 GMC family oxidoreductase N-terminal domain-containing protein [Paenibacillus arenilitoris]
MRIYIAGQGDTLLKIAHQFQLELDQLTAINPRISNPYKNIAGQRVNLDPHYVPLNESRVVAPFCPPVPESEFIPNWIPLADAEEMAETEYDVLIVGSGAGGGAALWRLCEQWGNNNKRIGIVERGPLYLPTHVANIATINGDNFRVYAPPEITDLIGNRLPQYPGMKLVYAAGGRTILWGAITPRIPNFEIADWPVSIEEMEMYYNIAEEVMSVTTTYTKGSSITQILLERLRENGFYNANDIPIAADLDQTKFGRLHSNVFFSSILFMARALSRRPFDLAVNTYAAEVITEGGKAAGVRVMTSDKKSYILKAKTVILSASALQTPRILLNSGIAGRAIGRYLTNHSYLIATASVSTTGFPEPLGALGIIVPESEDRPYRLQLQGPEQYFNYHYDKKPIKDEWEISFFGASGKVESRYENRVYIDPSRVDEYGMPELQVEFSYSEKDEAILYQMYESIQQASAAMKLRLAKINDALAICLMPPGADNHEFGTCRMGDDPLTSATDRYGQIHGVEGLYVADNSVLPSTGASNPTLSTVALAIRTADYIVRKLSTDENRQ